MFKASKLQVPLEQFRTSIPANGGGQKVSRPKLEPLSVPQCTLSRHFFIISSSLSSPTIHSYPHLRPARPQQPHPPNVTIHHYTLVTEPPQHIKLLVRVGVYLDNSCQATDRLSGTSLLIRTDMQDKKLGSEHIATAGA